MKRNAGIQCACLLVLGTGGLFGQPMMIAGWEFSQFPAGGFNAIGNVSEPDFSQAGALKANYSELLEDSAAGGPLAAEFGTLYYDGTNGSTSAGPLDISGTDTVFPFAQNLDSETEQVSPPYSSTASENVLIFNGQKVYNNFALKIKADNSLVFTADAGTEASAWEITFAFQTETSTAGGQSLSLEYFDGANFVSAGSPLTVTATDQGTTVALPGLDGMATVRIRMNISGAADANAVVIDNVGIAADLSGGGDPSFWAATPKQGEWRNSGEGYPGEPGIGWIFDANWPWVYTFGIGDPGVGHWMYIFEQGGSRAGFYAVVAGPNYFIYGSGTSGYYYSFEPGSEGWLPFGQ
ncbi:MAG: hypothetical protein GVY10_06655 [Verrucomicrobia bacterium]|nr:hypothetical protein [Verrucomicrobiota bacterium]